MKKKVTLKDVAIAAGVSTMTASRGLRGAGDVSQANIRKVQEAAKQIGYVGNHLAASFTKTRSNLIGVVVPNLTNIVFAHVLSGITSALEGKGFQPVFGVTDYDPDKEYEVVRNILSWHPAGMIVTGTNFPDHTSLVLRQAEIPLVQIMDTDGEVIDSAVGFSHEKAGYDMTRTLIEKGRTRFGFIGCNLERDFRAAKRHAGFLRALGEAGLTLQCEFLDNDVSSVSIGRTLAAQALDAAPDLDCIYFSNDDIAAGALFHCIDAGIEVPGRLVLAGFNGMDVARSFPGRIATSITDRTAIGAAAATQLLDRITSSTLPPPQCIVYEPIISLGALEEEADPS